MDVILATCRKRAELTPSDGLLAEALIRRGASVRAAPWDAVPPGRDGDRVVCIRSTWDYHRRPEDFREWISRFGDVPGTLWNPPATVLWNMDKVYLRELQGLGIPIPPTRWIEPGESFQLPQLFADTGWESAVLKPRVSATAYGTHLVSPDSALPEAERAPLGDCGALLQEFVPEVRSRGEISLVYLDGRLSHAVRKLPSEGEFRVQAEFGGSAARCEPGPALREFGAAVLRRMSVPWIYARVDLIDTAAGPVLMELELVEPELFFALAPERADHLAAALLRRATREAA